MFEFQPNLRGDLISLRPLCEQDFEPLFSVASDPLIWEQHPQFDRYRKDIFLEFFKNASAALVIQDVQTEEVIGSSRFYELDPDGAFIFIGYTFLMRRYWGGALNRELKRLMLNHALLSVPEVRFHIGEKNMRSRRAVEKVGAKILERVVDPQKDQGIGVRLIYSLNK